MVRLGLILLGIALSSNSRGQSGVLFSLDGRISSLKLSGVDVLKTDGMRNGFSLLHFNGISTEEIALTQVKRVDNDLHVGHPDAFPKLVFSVKEAGNYVALILKRAEGIPADGKTSLRLLCQLNTAVEVVKLDYMVDNRSAKNELAVYWPYLWHRSETDPLGGIAFYLDSNDTANDESLADIWANEHLPHPDTGKPWTREAVLTWIESYHRKFAGLRETTLSASSNEELYYLTERMKAAGVNRIYLHTDTWRGEYWPRQHSFTNVNTEVFPAGLSDLKAYGQYLKENGMMLRLHNVSGGIGRRDPEHVLGDKISEDLSVWVEGKLVASVSATDTLIRFEPLPGSSIPNSNLKRSWWDLSHFRVGNEIIHARAISGTDKTIWTLHNSSRGFDGSHAAAHGKGTRVGGLLSAYGQNYIPKPNSLLFEEMAYRYADFLNEVKADHQHYDGYEIHSIPPWGSEKFSYLVAGRLKKPTTTSTSGGRGTVWQLERRFSAIKNLNEIHGYWAANIPVLLDGNRRASSLLDAHFEMSAMIMNGARRVGLYKPEPMFGVSGEMLDQHGLSPEFLRLASEWGKLMPHINADDVAYLNGFFQGINRELRQRGNHYQSRDVPVLDIRADGYYWVPTRVLVDEENDDYWVFGQEFGATGPRQFISSGGSLTLHNPYGAQPPRVVLRVLDAYKEPDGPSPGRQEKAADARAESISDYRLGADLANAKVATTVSENEFVSDVLWPSANTNIVQDGISEVILADSVLSVFGKNQFNEPVWSEERHASWDVDVPLNGRRALALDIVGDSSNAVLVVQLIGKERGVRDYVVKLDFLGKKRFVIPNGEVAWTNAHWGWRFGAKHFDYSGTVAKVRMGIGYLPGNTAVDVQVLGLRLLDNADFVVKSPEIHINDGKLEIKGDLHPGEYFTYDDGLTGKVFDQNWNFLREVEVEHVDFIASQGTVHVVITDKNTGLKPWCELQLLTKGEPYKIAAAPAVKSNRD